MDMREYVNFQLIGCYIVLFLSCCLMTRVYARYAKIKGFLDVPNARSAHHTITPRGAGVVFVSIWLIFVFLAFSYQVISTEFFKICFPATCGMMFLGFWEDIKSLSPRRRLFLQGIAALGVLFFLGSSVNGFHLLSSYHFYTLGTLIASCLIVLWLMWSTNLFNFMDGLDGLAAIEALFVFGVTGFLFFKFGDPNLAYLVWGLCFTIFGFLVWNWPKAIVFMGDVGSYCLGFLIAVFSIIGDIKFGIPYLLWVIVYGLFWFDATVTLLRRLLMGKNVAMAHRDHAYQRLHQAGLSHQKILYYVIGINTFLASITIWVSLHQTYMIPMFLLMLLVLSLYYYQAERLVPMEKNHVQ